MLMYLCHNDLRSPVSIFNACLITREIVQVAQLFERALLWRALE